MNTAAITETLKFQLKTGGILVAPVGGSGGQTMMRIIRHSENDFTEESHGGYIFVPMLPGKAED